MKWFWIIGLVLAASVSAVGIVNAKKTAYKNRPAKHVVVKKPAARQAQKRVNAPALALKDVDNAMVNKANGFSINLFRKVFADNEENPAISPVSIVSALAMCANGDNGVCRNEVLKVLGYGPGELARLNQYCHALITDCTATEGDTQCAFANSLWYKPDRVPYKEYTDILHRIFDADIYSLYLGSKEGKDSVNAYINRNSRGLIPTFLDEPKKIPVAIVNVTYFKGAWQFPFEKERTHPRAFHNLDGTVTNTPFMLRDLSIRYAETEKLVGAELQYSDPRFRLTLIKPKEGGSLSEVVSSLTPAVLSTLYKKIHKEEGDLLFPKFEIKFQGSMLPYLKKMGLKESANPHGAGFHKMMRGFPYFIDDVSHAVVVKVDEKGTEAAGATFVSVTEECIRETPVIIFDQPFLYVLRDTLSDTVLFIGAVTKF